MNFELRQAAQKQKQKTLENKKLRKLRTKFRGICTSLSWGPSLESVEALCNKLSLPKMTALVKSLENDPPEISKKLFEEEVAFKQIRSLTFLSWDGILENKRRMSKKSLLVDDHGRMKNCLFWLKVLPSFLVASTIVGN